MVLAMLVGRTDFQTGQLILGMHKCHLIQISPTRWILNALHPSSRKLVSWYKINNNDTKNVKQEYIQQQNSAIIMLETSFGYSISHLQSSFLSFVQIGLARADWEIDFWLVKHFFSFWSWKSQCFFVSLRTRKMSRPAQAQILLYLIK